MTAQQVHPCFAEAVLYLHPNADPRRDFLIENHGDGPVLSAWNLPGDPPSDAAIAAALAEIDAHTARRLVPKTVIVDRLEAVGKLQAARTALDAADLYMRERWNSRSAIYADDAAAIALLQSVGAEAADILAA